MLTILIAFVGFFSFLNNSDYNKVTPLALGASLLASSNEGVLPSSLDDKISSDISFLTALISLKKIKIESELFKNKSFLSLQDNSVKIEPIIPGRANPFAPMDENSWSNAQTIKKIVTNQPTQITDKSAILNGTLNVIDGVTDIYFEYGTTDKLGLKSSLVKQSLVGTFVKSIVDLSPETNYFTKACAKINNVVVCGDVVSFTTQ